MSIEMKAISRGFSDHGVPKKKKERRRESGKITVKVLKFLHGGFFFTSIIV